MQDALVVFEVGERGVLGTVLETPKKFKKFRDVTFFVTLTVMRAHFYEEDVEELLDATELVMDVDPQWLEWLLN